MEFGWDFMANALSKLIGKRETDVHKTEPLITGQDYTLKYSRYGYHLLVRIKHYTVILLGAVSKRDFPFAAKASKSLFSYDNRAHQQSHTFSAASSFSLGVSYTRSD